MNHNDFSRAYYDLVDKSTQYHESHKSWAGFSQASYVKDIKALVEKHNVKSLLDYGCGKGQQYIEKLEYTPGVFQTFNEYLNIDSSYKFDPCWKEFKNPPEENQKFDAVMMIQAIGFIPDHDIDVLKNILMNHTTKFCFIGENYSTYGKVKPKKVNLLDSTYFKEVRTPDWYKEKFSDWTGSELIFKFI
jgi:SAM-dependent methyltransferase